MSFAALKKQRGNFADLSKKLADEKKGGGGNGPDERYWKLTTDEAGNGYAVIRFLTAPVNEEYPFVKMYSHAFKNDRTGKWYIENCRSTINEADPVMEVNSELWNSGIEANKDLARKQKRNLKYISNILVIKDSKNPQNEGKVFLFAYGSKIFEMIEAALQPKFEDEKPFNPFDFWDGADFNLKAYNGSNKQRSYDKSGFSAPAPLFGGDDAALETLWNKQYSLQAEVAPEKFKSYDQLKTRLQAVLGNAPGGRPASQATSQAQAVEREFAEPARPATRQEPAASASDNEDLSQYAALLEGFDS
ncbi:single stranded DNA-binding protein [Xanthomonas phage BUDD]|nr:single stranded DNA-binding protein [Xanthomonas phage BUDD]WEM34340.1 single stranded DNA-binding protein [Xanthomonas phage X1]